MTRVSKIRLESCQKKKKEKKITCLSTLIPRSSWRKITIVKIFMWKAANGEKRVGFVRWSLAAWESFSFRAEKKNDTVKRCVESNRLVLCLPELYALCWTNRRTLILEVDASISTNSRSCNFYSCSQYSRVHLFAIFFSNWYFDILKRNIDEV